MGSSSGFTPPSDAPKKERVLDYVAYDTVAAKGFKIGDQLERRVKYTEDALGVETILLDQWFNIDVDALTPLASAPLLGQEGLAATEAISRKQFRKVLGYESSLVVGATVVQLTPSGATASPQAGNATSEEANLVEMHIEPNGGAVVWTKDNTDPVGDPNIVGEAENNGADLELEGEDEIANFKIIRKSATDGELNATYIFQYYWNE